MATADTDGSGADDTPTITVGDTITDEGAAEPVTLPVAEVLTGRGFITGKSGSGKSNTASVVIERLLAGGYPVLIVDTDGEYWGLKQDHELLHAGADEECDVQVGPEHAEKLASLALDRNVPIILDVSSFLDDAEANALIREVAAELFAREKKAKQPFLMLIEECHEYIPEGGGLDDTGQMLVKVGKRGRKHGLGLVGISQRPADVKKDFITQANWLVWHRLTWDNDVRTARRIIDSAADHLDGLSDGEGFLQADWREDDLLRVQFHRKQTFDAGATPGLEAFERPDLKGLGDSLVDELEEISESSARRQDQIAELEAEVERKEETIEQLQQSLHEQEQMQQTFDRMADAMLSRADSGDAGEQTAQTIKAEVMEVRQEKQAIEDDLAAARDRIDELAAERDALESEIADLRAEVDRREERIANAEEIERENDDLRTRVATLEDRIEIAQDALAGDVAIDASLQDYTDPDADIDVDEELQADLKQARERIHDLEAEVERLREANDAIYVPSDYEAFVQDDVVREQIRDTIENSKAGEDYVKAVISAILEAGGSVTLDEIVTYPGTTDSGAGKSHASRAASQLAERKVVDFDREPDPKTVDFNVDGVAEIKHARRRREERRELMDSLDT